MSFEIAVFFTTFVFLGTRLVLSVRRGGNPLNAVQEREHTQEIHELVRPTLLFSTTVPVARC